MGTSTVAIILSNYNQGAYLRESLDAICSQTRPADEIVVIDDGSTDESVVVIEEFAQRYPTIRFLRNERNLGLQESIARALPLVTSDYLVWAASDDRLLPMFLQRSMAVLERHPEAGLCFSELSVLRGEAGQIERLAVNPEVKHIFDLSALPEYMVPADIIDRMKRAYLPISSNSVVVRRDALLAIGGYPKGLEWHSDSFAYTVIALRHGACVVPETLALIRARPGSYSDSGMRDPLRQWAVLTAMLDLLARRDYRDIRRVFRRCPSNFSPWGALMLELQLRRVRDWDLFLPHFLWKIKDYKRGRRLSWPGTFAALSLRLMVSVWRRLKAWLAHSPAGVFSAESCSSELFGHIRERPSPVLAGPMSQRPLEEFTLVVPTYNRPAGLARLLRYLERLSAPFPILVLDSGTDESKAANASLVAEIDLDVRLISYDSSITPFEKFCRGSEEVKTAFSSLCADDDVVKIDSLQTLVEFLRDHPDFSAAHGWYFTFYDNVHVGITTIVYSGPSIDGDDPLLRLRDLLNRYEAVTYAVYRTDVMRRSLHEVQRVGSMLARELLAGELTVLWGKVARLPMFYYGRSLGPSESYAHWHPVDFLISAPEELFKHYAECREILFEWFGKNGHGNYSLLELSKLLDLMHLKYFSEYISPEIVNYLIDEVMAGTDPKEVLRGYWPLLTPATSRGRSFGRWRERLKKLRDRLAPGVRLRDVSRLLGMAGDQIIVTKTVDGHRREYRLYKGFLESLAKAGPGEKGKAVESIIQTLNAYE